VTEHYDVVVIGAGPAGIFTALELTELCPECSLAIIDKGPPLEARSCPQLEEDTECLGCRPCRLLSGWGGAGAFSDGKLTLTPRIGGWLDQYIEPGPLQDYLDYVDSRYVEFGAPDRVFEGEPDRVASIRRKAAGAGLEFIPGRLRHLGTDNCPEILKAMHRQLADRCDIMMGSTAKQVCTENGCVTGVELADGTRLSAATVVLAPGREGADWFSREAQRLGLQLIHNPVDVGVRIETPAVIMEPMTDVLFESKLLYFSQTFDDRVRTFCVCPYGEVVVENNNGLQTVNGRSFERKQSENTNFALLVSKTFTKPFNEPIEYGKNIASLANLLGDGVLVQRLGDLLSGRRSTERRMKRGMVRPTLQSATPGDISLVLPYRHLVSILEMIGALNELVPGVKSQHTLLYGIEVKFYSSRVALTNSLECEIKNLFTAGDGAGVSRGLAQASASGVHVAREISTRF
jgi:hypothetical protein